MASTGDVLKTNAVATLPPRSGLVTATPFRQALEAKYPGFARLELVSKVMSTGAPLEEFETILSSMQILKARLAWLVPMFATRRAHRLRHA